ncbi:hypothetical protein I2I05_03235 [Hymenobacter sp. BT683]|uniref:Outer membrane protein beta-barrel domain-containing protein n=1 Tax=Hymenobacter jeongseonensis TaxID=2791027 RepID=A0ABS0IDG2_9BACT|nr:hypothetical protein [Hymenobacter jeongseonensis]MBF9236400.1 hypothetical protein [Hymenobacter jeongseonensis]
MKQLLLLSCSAGVLSGCAVTLAPHTPYIPVIRDKGQTELAVATGVNGSELKGGYQLTDKLLVHAALLDFGQSRRTNKFRSADLGLGYYYNSPNGFWRLGMHGGAAYGGGTSNGSEEFENLSPTPGSHYKVRYTYGYLQPTIIHLQGNQVWGVGLRVARAYYHRFAQLRADTLGGPLATVNYQGRQAAFVQLAFQYSYQVMPWLSASTSFGVQGFLNKPQAIGDMNPFIGQVGLHFTINKRSITQP